VTRGELLRYRLCDIVVVNVHTPTDDDPQKRLYEELEHVLNKFTPVRSINCQNRQRENFQPTVWDERFHKFNNGNAVKVLSFGT
jgi:hypothetical protein